MHDRAAQVEFDVDDLGDKRDDVVSAVAEPCLIRVELQGSKGRQLLAQHRFEDAQCQVEVVDIEADGIVDLAGKGLVEIETAGGRQTDERVGVADPQRCDLDLDVLDGREVGANLNVRDFVQALEQGIKLGRGFEDEFIQLRSDPIELGIKRAMNRVLDLGALRIDRRVERRQCSGGRGLKRCVDGLGHRSRDPADGAGQRLLQRAAELCVDLLADRVEERIEQVAHGGLQRRRERGDDRIHDGIDHRVDQAVERQGPFQRIELIGDQVADRRNGSGQLCLGQVADGADVGPQFKLEPVHDGVDQAIHLGVDLIAQ